MKKPIQLLLLVFALQTVVSCCTDVKFFDYNSFFLTKPDVEITEDEELILELHAEDLRFHGTLPEFGITSAMATSCNEGWGGMKDAIMSISVTSNADFDSLHVAGAPLDDLFTYRAQYYTDDNTFKSLSKVSELSAYGITLKLSARPTQSMTHNFTIRVRKCSGQTMIVQTEEIEWV